MTRRQTVALGTAVAIMAVLYGIWRWNEGGNGPFGGHVGSNQIIISGNIEAHESVLSFTAVEAPIAQLPFDEGAAVAQGTVLARLDDRLYRQQVQIDGANMRVATAQLAVNQGNLDALQHSLVSDEADLAEKQIDYRRAEKLAKLGAGSTQSRDLAATALAQSAAALAHDQSMTQAAEANIALAAANLDVTQARLRLDQITLGYTVLTAPFAGTIAAREAELGELAGPGVAIFTLDDLDHVWLRGYVNEPDLGKIRLGQAVEVATDAYPGKIYQGRISFISPQAEFTPKTVETNAERVTLVYRVKIDIANPTHELLPGMPADARINLLPSGS